MIVNEERKTTAAQRVVIILIAVFLLGSTFALYAGIILGQQNSEKQSEIANEQFSRFSELYSEYNSRVTERGEQLSGQYFDKFKDMRSRVKAFNAADVNELKTNDIVVGDGAPIEYTYDENGEVVSYNTNYAAYYIGWLSDETIFDSSYDSADAPTSLKAPLNGSEQMIRGWLEGIEGMRIGGIREITVPSILGYGSTSTGTIPADSPLKFIVMLIERPAPLEVSDELETLFYSFYGYSLRDSQ